MKTDKQFYELFSANPEWLFELTNRPSPGRSQMHSVALKALDQTTDSLVIPDDPDQPLTVGEFQFQLDRTVYARTVIAMALVQIEYQDRDVEGLILFGSPAHDPEIEPWTRVVDCYHLEDAVRRLEESSPEHPLTAVFKPLIESNENVLERDAVCYLRRIRDSPLEPPLRETLEDVFVSWLEQRFRDRSKQEIEAMFQQDLPDLRETRSGQQLLEIGREEGREEGRELGLSEGQRQARLETLRASVKRIVRAQTGSLSDSDSAAIDAVTSADRLDQMELALLAGTPLSELL